MTDALERSMSNTLVPAKHIITLVRDFKDALQRHEDLSTQTEASLSKHEELSSSLQETIEQVNLLADQISEAMQIAQDAADHAKSLNPKDGKDADEELIIQRVLQAIPKPEKGKDGTTPEFDAIVKAVSKQMPKPKDGKTPTIDTDAILDELIAKLQEGDVLTKDHIKGLDAEISSYRSQLAGKHYGTDTWARGGGDTVSAGSNVTISTVGGVKVISASGGGAASPSTPTGTVNAVNTVFGVTAQPGSVVADGITYFLGAGYSYSAPNITMDVAPSQYIRYYV